MRYTSLLVAAALLGQFAFTAPQVAEARAPRYTISQRHNALIAKINRFQRTGELTMREANSLREDDHDIRRREARMRSKNGGKLSYSDINKIERELNDLSNKIHRKALNKRVN